MEYPCELIILDECGSTSSEVKDYLTQGKPPPFWILTRKQNAGYGRQKRTWQMQVGDFAGSFAIIAQGQPRDFGYYSFIIALSCFNALQSSFSNSAYSPDIKLKWPNDILIDGKKICGMLLELINNPVISKPCLCIGIGINIVSKPEDTPYPVACLNDYNISIDIDDLATHIHERFIHWYTLFQQSGFAPIRKAWLAHASHLGQDISVQSGAEQIRGTFTDINDYGHLLLLTDKGLKEISAGDVFF